LPRYVWYEDERPKRLEPRPYYRAMVEASQPDSRDLFCTCTKYGYAISKGYANGHSMQCQRDWIHKLAGGVGPCSRCKSRQHDVKDCAQKV